MKFHIIGCSGTGKTYLAKLLSLKYNIPHYDLDNIFWDNSSNKYGTKIPVEKRLKLLNDILKNDNWIIEGVYYSWLNSSFEKADKIIVLDMPKHTYLFRLTKRFIKRKLGLEQHKKETIKSFLALVKWTKTFQNENLPQIYSILNIYLNKTIFLYNKKEVYTYIKNGN